MPYLTGYQVCEHIKQTENLQHIPVMLLVGSFEPFDEIEARRVGADDILTKPFQSIRTLVDKVGALVGRGTAAHHVARVPELAAEPTPAEASTRDSLADAEAEPVGLALSHSEQDANTRELPPPEFDQPPKEPMTTAELEITTADTLRLSPEIRQHLERFSADEVRKAETVWEAETMHTNFDIDTSPEPAEGFGDALLDLSHLEPAGFPGDDDGILDIDFDSAAPGIVTSPPVNIQTVGADLPASGPAFSSGFVEESVAFLAPGEETLAERIEATEFPTAAHTRVETVSESESSWLPSDTPAVENLRQREQTTQSRVGSQQAQPTELSTSAAGGSTSTGLITLAQLSPEVVDAIARRAVEQLSEKVVQEVAWEVVPHLAELMIKRMLEEHDSQKK